METMLTSLSMLSDVMLLDVATTAAEAADAAATALFTANNIWMMLSAGLVFIMHLGFAGVEAGFGQSKNTVNILFKNTITPIIGLITYFILGFNLMYPGEFDIIGGVLGFAGFGIGLGDMINSSTGADGSDVC
jgi:Amt family ammonium transporter